MPDHNQWSAFVLPWDDTSPGPTDVSFLLNKPAGATGYVHLATGDGQRWRWRGCPAPVPSPGSR